MSDKVFELSLSTLAGIVMLWIVAGVALGIAGIRWANLDISLLIFLTILIGLVVLILSGITLLHFWGKNYMARE
jgi:hypothetical protein